MDSANPDLILDRKSGLDPDCIHITIFTAAINAFPMCEQPISRWHLRSYWQSSCFICAPGEQGSGKLGDDKQQSYGDSTTQ